MPWKVSGVVEKREQFVEQWLSQQWTMTELCARHGISRQAGYNTWVRYQQAGWKGLESRSRARGNAPFLCTPSPKPGPKSVNYVPGWTKQSKESRRDGTLHEASVRRFHHL